MLFGRRRKKNENNMRRPLKKFVALLKIEMRIKSGKKIYLNVNKSQMIVLLWPLFVTVSC